MGVYVKGKYEENHLQVTTGVVNSLPADEKTTMSWVNETVISKFYTSISVNTLGIH